MKKLLLLLLFVAVVGCSKSSETVRANTNPQTTISYSITPNKDVYEPGEEFVIEATITGKTIIAGTPIEIFWESIPSTLNDNNEFTPTISDNTLMYTNSASSTPGEYIDITATPIQISINDIPQVTGNYTIRIITASTSEEDSSEEDNSEEDSSEENSSEEDSSEEDNSEEDNSEEDSEYTPTAEEVSSLQSITISVNTLNETSFLDENGEETNNFFKPLTIDPVEQFNNGSLGTVDIEYNTLYEEINNNVTIMVNQQVSISNIIGITNYINEQGQVESFGNTESEENIEYFYLDQNGNDISYYDFFTNESNDIQYSIIISFQINNGTIFSTDVLTGIELISAASHESITCNSNDGYILYESSQNLPIKSDTTLSGYAEVILYTIENSDEGFLKVCL